MAKQSLKFVPILGWCWCCTDTIFVRRVWDNDRETLVRDLQKTLSNYPRNYFFNVKKPTNILHRRLSLAPHLSTLADAVLRRDSIYRDEARGQYEDCSGKRLTRT